MLLPIWGCFCMFMVFFYTSNLRAFLIAPAYESFIEGSEDALERGETVYIPSHYRMAKY